ncbi:hypothetical protein IV203_014609 [Nitzschia inconspicua]|uniref:Uncharacterized protein n=1 Tax=Nitzschia inconspicua TaxID=303405 RepID=A0A9K3L9I4_9STRA|nr:hypothetical protein IV203_014609 [Nitzschia inconspicua]
MVVVESECIHVSHGSCDFKAEETTKREVRSEEAGVVRGGLYCSIRNGCHTGRAWNRWSLLVVTLVTLAVVATIGWVISTTRHGTTKSSGPYAGAVYVGYAPYALLMEKGVITAKEIGPEGPLIRVENVLFSVNETIHADVSMGDTVDIFSTAVCGNMTECPLRTDWKNQSYNSGNDGIVPRISTVLMNGNVAFVNSSYAIDENAPKRRSAYASVFIQDVEGRIVSLRIEAVDNGLPFGVTVQGFSYTNTEADAECNETASYDFCGQRNRLPDFAALPTWALPCELVADMASTGTLDLALKNTFSRCEHGRGLELVEVAA